MYAIPGEGSAGRDSERKGGRRVDRELSHNAIGPMPSQPIAFDTSRALRPLNTSSSLKITALMKELGLVNSLVDGNGNERVEKTE